MGLLGKFFKGSGDQEESSGSRTKRGRAPSIRRAADGSPAGAGAPLPEINIDDIEKARQAQPAASKREPSSPPDITARAKPAERPPIEVDVGGPAPAAKPKAPAVQNEPAGPAARTEKPTAPAGGSQGGTAASRSSRLQSRQKPIGELLIQAGSVSTEQLSRALKIQDKGGKGLVGQILANMGACPQAAILAALNRQFRISTVDLERIEISSAVASLVAADKCREHRLIPFEKIGTTLCISMANCLNRKAINEVEELTKLKVKPFNSTWIEIRKAIDAIAKAGATAPATPTAGAASGTEAAHAAPGQQAVSMAPASSDAVQVAPEVPVIPVDVLTDGSGTKPVPAVQAEESSAEPPPFVGPAKAHIEGLDTLDSTEAEVVQETERGLASKHLDEIRRRRAERQKIMGTGKGVVGRLVAPDLDAYRPEGDAATTESAGIPAALTPLRVVDEELLAGATLPTARQLAANIEEFRSSAAPAPGPVAPEADSGPAPKSEEAPAPVDEKPPPAELPSVPAISFKPEEPSEVAPAPISDKEWAAMEAELEPDPVVAWQATYASAGPVPAAPSWL